LLFVPLCITVYVVAVCIIGDLSPFHSNLNYQKSSYGHMQTRMSEVRTVEKVDILFLGSSHAYRGFDVRYYQELGLDVFNLGSSSQSPIQSKLLLDRYLEKLNPNHIIFEINVGRLASDGVESSVDIIANDRNDWHSIEMAFNIRHLKTINTLIYGFYKDVFSSEVIQEPKVRGEDEYIKGGFVAKKLKYFDKKEDYPEVDYTWRKNQLEALDEISMMASEHDVRLTFVHSPITESYYKTYPNMDQFDEYMKSVGEYINFNKILDLDDSVDFYDPRHLNQNGVEKFNRAVIDILDLKETQIYLHRAESL